MNRFLTICVLPFALASVTGATQDRAKTPDATPTLAITRVTVIDTVGGARRPDSTVIIRDGRIVAVEPARNARVPKKARILDGRGKFLIPGLWDMHVHWWHKEHLTLLVANGVTGARVMWGSADHHQWRKEVESGNFLGPRQFIGSAIFDGPDPVWKGSVTLGSEAEARAAVREAKAQGADFIKVYVRLPRDAFFAIVDETRKTGLTFAGHVPASVSVSEASDAGQRSVEHLDQLRVTASSREAELRAVPRGSLAPEDINLLIHEALHSFDKEKAATLFAHLRRNATWQCPTLVAPRWRAFSDDAAFRQDPRLAYMRPWLRQAWEEAPSLRQWTKKTFARQKEIFDGTLRMVGELHQAGVGLLAGTDIGNPYLYPGSSLHDELQLFVQAGLTPLESLRTATLNPARFLARESDFGSVEKGKVADLVLLDADPLADIRNTQKISAVIFGGRVLDRAELDRVLAEVERIANQPDP